MAVFSFPNKRRNGVRQSTVTKARVVKVMAELKTIDFSPYPHGRPKDYYPITSPQAAASVERSRPAPSPVPPESSGRQRLIAGEGWEQAILEACRQSPEAVRITGLVNRVARLDPYRTWQEFEARVGRRLSASCKPTFTRPSCCPPRKVPSIGFAGPASPRNVRKRFMQP